MSRGLFTQIQVFTPGVFRLNVHKAELHNVCAVSENPVLMSTGPRWLRKVGKKTFKHSFIRLLPACS